MSAVFFLDQVLACTESATSEYSTPSQCLSALQGRPGRVKFILNGLRWQKNQCTHHSYTTNCLATQTPFGVINTAATRGGNESHSRGGGAADHSLKKIPKTRWRETRAREVKDPSPSIYNMYFLSCLSRTAALRCVQPFSPFQLKDMTLHYSIYHNLQS